MRATSRVLGIVGSVLAILFGGTSMLAALFPDSGFSGGFYPDDGFDTVALASEPPPDLSNAFRDNVDVGLFCSAARPWQAACSA